MCTPCCNAAHLGVLTDTAEDDGMTEPQVPTIGLKARANLGGQFPRGSQHQDAGSAGGNGARLGLEAMQDGQGEGRGLARSRLGVAQQITARQ